jgi:hypothetical protein
VLPVLLYPLVSLLDARRHVVVAGEREREREKREKREREREKRERERERDLLDARRRAPWSTKS